MLVATKVMLSETHLRLYENCKAILLDDDLQLDAHERVGLLTVIAGVRPVGLFLGVEEPDFVHFAWVLGQSDITPVTLPEPTTAHTWESTHPVEIVRLFRQRDPKPGLWLCRGSGHVKAINHGIDQISVGRLLGYPECCIQAHQAAKGDFESAVIAGYINAYENNPEKIADALLKNFTVEIEWKDDKRVQRTTVRFPFVQHIACEACLNGESSPTAIINSKYGQLVEGVDHYLYDYLLRLAGNIEMSEPQ